MTVTLPMPNDTRLTDEELLEAINICGCGRTPTSISIEQLQSLINYVYEKAVERDRKEWDEANNAEGGFGSFK